jgi:hypothetical protein
VSDLRRFAVLHEAVEQRKRKRGSNSRKKPDEPSLRKLDHAQQAQKFAEWYVGVRCQTPLHCGLSILCMRCAQL